jgi:hypothetical protein
LVEYTGGPKRDFVTLRGGTPDDRPLAEKPYSAASYAAQYGVPLEDVEDILRHVSQKGENTHGEVRRLIYKEWLSDGKFREESLEHKVRPLKREEEVDDEES